VLVAFSCRGRSFCPSCEKKRQILWAEWLCEEVLAKVAHRHVVLSIPRLLRPLLRRRRELLTELARAAAEAVSELVRRGLGDAVRPGVVVSIATAGDLLQWHPHVHLLTTDGGRTAEGSWQPLPQWDGGRLMSLFRERLLARLVEAHAMSHELVAKLLAWRHPGFSAHVGEELAPEEKQRLCDTAAYLVRNPLSLKKLVYLDGEKAVVYRSRMNPFLGRNFEAMDPLEWLARLCDHIPDPGQHRTLFYGEYSSRVRGCGASDGPEALAAEQPPPRKRSSPSWGRLIAKVYQVDPLLCTRCGKRMSTIAFVTDQLAIGMLLDHLAVPCPAPRPWARARRTAKACSTPARSSTSGASTGTRRTTTPCRRRATHADPTPESVGRARAAPGGTTCAGRHRPPGAACRPRSGTPTTAFAWCSRSGERSLASTGAAAGRLDHAPLRLRA
jgi:hypothetical protein